MTDDMEVERLLREVLAARAERAPDGAQSAALADRILHEASLRPIEAPRSPRTWRAWGLPLVAAGAVAAVAVTLLVVADLRTTTVHQSPVASGPVSHPPVVSSPAPAVSATVSARVQPDSVKNLTNFVADAMTFVGPDTGWVLGSADCLSGPGRCTAMAHTTYGSMWSKVLNPPVNVPGVNDCAAPCATQLRFADAEIGYAFGPDTLVMTTDGGAHWSTQPGGAYALETLDTNVIRVVADHSGCPGPCNVQVEYAPNGGTKWTPVHLPGAPVDASGVTLSRTGSAAYLFVSFGSAANPQPALLFVSADDGHTWTRHQDACTGLGAWMARELTTSADGSVSLLCADAADQHQAITTSTDDGAQFAAGPAFQLDGGPSGSLAAASATTFVVSAGNGLYRTTDAGATWKLVLRDPSAGTAQCGFQTGTDAHCTSNDGRTLYASSDAGAHWARTPVS